MTSILSSIDGIIVHSESEAKVVARVVRESRWYGVVFCLSPACAAPFAGLPGLLVETARVPTEESLLSLLRFLRGRTDRTNGRSVTAGGDSSAPAAWPGPRLVVSNAPSTAAPAWEAVVLAFLRRND